MKNVKELLGEGAKLLGVSETAAKKVGLEFLDLGSIPHFAR